MEVRLQDAVSAVHVTKSANMQNLITTASIRAGARTFFYKCAFVASQKQRCFPFFDRIWSAGDTVIYFLVICYDYGRYIKVAGDATHHRRICNLLIDEELLNRHEFLKTYSDRFKFHVPKITTADKLYHCNGVLYQFNRVESNCGFRRLVELGWQVRGKFIWLHRGQIFQKQHQGFALRNFFRHLSCAYSLPREPHR